MSNVRPRKKPLFSHAKSRSSDVEQEFTTMLPCPSLTQRHSSTKAPARVVLSNEAVHARTIEIAFQSASALEAPPRVNVGQFVGAGAVAPARSARSRSQWCLPHRSGRAVVASAIHQSSAPRPNPSIEGTSTSGLRPLAAAPHVKR